VSRPRAWFEIRHRRTRSGRRRAQLAIKRGEAVRGV
jgi:hypothetical protein